MIEVEVKPIIDEWIRQEKDEIYKSIRERRTNIMELMQKIPVSEAMQLQVFMNELNAIEYLLLKGGEK